jgi:CO/xanthine dehydrogenase Mo-binding subunit
MISSGAVANGIGQPVRRKEDFRLLTGRGGFADDIQLPRLAHAVIVRSPHAHAQIQSIDIAAPLGSPGVLAVLTGSLLQIIGKGSDQQVAAETHRRARAMQLAPDKPQFLCRPIEQPGEFDFDLDQARLSGSVVPIAQ